MEAVLYMIRMKSQVTNLNENAISTNITITNALPFVSHNGIQIYLEFD